ncbi:MAG: RHS repeat-associated core domain-containing protein, partial [Sulfurifustis sp.]
ATTLYGYSPYGEATQLGESNDNSLQYTGRENDDTGVYYYRARYYDPQLKRFVSEDPIGLDGGSNVYAYVDADPLRQIDPYGLESSSSDDLNFPDPEVAEPSLERPYPECSLPGMRQLCSLASSIQNVLESCGIDGKRRGAPYSEDEKEHKKNSRPSTRNKHEEGQAQTRKNKGGEKGDLRRPYRRR